MPDDQPPKLPPGGHKRRKLAAIAAAAGAADVPDTAATAEVPPKRKRPPGPGRGHHEKIGNGAGGQYFGPGWGGQAKGAHPHKPREDGSPSTQRKPTQPAPPVPERHGIAGSRAQELREEMMRILVSIARNGEQEGARIIAADKVLDSLIGKAVQPTVNTNIQAPHPVADALRSLGIGHGTPRSEIWARLTGALPQIEAPTRPDRPSDGEAEAPPAAVTGA